MVGLLTGGTVHIVAGDSYILVGHTRGGFIHSSTIFQSSLDLWLLYLCE